MLKIPKELNNFYNSLENLESLDIWNIQNELRESERLNRKWDEKVLTERKVLFHNLNNGELISNAQLTNSKGEIINSIEFSKKEIEYLKERLDHTNNFWLKSRYSHILWQITKHKQFAEIAFENYFKTVNTIKANEARELSSYTSAIFNISKKTKFKLDEAKTFAFELINDLPAWLKASIANEILFHNLFDINDLNKVTENIDNWVELKNPVAYFTNKVNLEIALKIFEKINKPREPLYLLLANNEDLILNEHTDDTDFIKITTIGNKATYLKKAKQEVELQKTLKEYNRLKQKVRLKKISISLDADKNRIFNEYLDLKSKSILMLPSESILAYFSLNEDIIVDPTLNKQNAEKAFKNSLYHLFSTSSFDINTNFKILNEKEKLDRQTINSYIIAHNIQCYTLFLKVFVSAIMTGKINYYTIYNFLEKHSWYGMKFHRSMSDDGIDDESSWLSMLAPGIHNLFSQYELSILLNNNRINNFILSIDSLTLKFEGALRDFIRLSGGTTTKNQKDELKEQLLEELLENEIIKKYFSIKDIELFKHTFTNKGRNIRNNVAHCFYQYSDYNLQVAVLVFFCILRLGKYSMTEN